MSHIAMDKYLNVTFQYDPATIDRIRAIDGRKWNGKFKRWEVPVNIFNYDALQAILPKPITIDRNVLDWYATNKRQSAVVDITKFKDYRFKTKPYAHQRTSVEWMLLKQSGCLFFECGLGKTKTALDMLQFMFFYQTIKRALIVVPLSVVNTWRAEIVKHTEIMSVEILTDMTMAKRKEILAGTDKKLYIINYDAIKSMEEEIKAKKFDVIILDESTYIKSYKAQRTKALLNLSQHIPHRFVMTGTPFGQRVLDVYSQVKFACPQAFPESWFSFRNNYCEMGGYKGKEITGNKNMDELERRIKGVAKIYRKVDCLDLPPKIYETRTCELTGEQKTHYRDMLEFLFAVVNQDTVVNVTGVLTQMMKLVQITGGFIFSNKVDGEGDLIVLKDNPKLKLLEETLDELGGQKTVIFCKFRHDIDIIASRLGNMCVTFTGDTTPKERDEAIQRFNTDPNCLYFLATSAGGYGLNLFVSHTIIFYSHEWSVEKRSQMEDRIHRSGQTMPCTIIDLVCTRDGKQTIDGYVVSACKEKRDITSALVDRIKNKEIEI